MKTSIVVFTACALSVFAIGADLRLAGRPHKSALVPPSTAIVAQQVNPVENSASRRTPVKVLPTVTVVADAAAIARADAGLGDDTSVMAGTVVDAAARAIVVPDAPSLPRARLGNPFYDFGRRGSAAATTE